MAIRYLLIVCGNDVEIIFIVRITVFYFNFHTTYLNPILLVQHLDFLKGTYRYCIDLLKNLVHI